MPRVFVYGEGLPGKPDAGWFAGLPATPASSRGSLWVRQGRPALLPDPSYAHVAGWVVDVPEARMGVLDALESGNGLARRRLTVRVEGRGLDAEAWVLTRAPGPRQGWRRLRAPGWTAMDPSGG
jgi:gamma-glutamylcyclotransferase (GGCT)/AIG2-like uncharacterized protein YtfP